MHSVLLESPWWVGVHQRGLVMFKPGFCFDPVINLGIDNISNDSSGFYVGWMKLLEFLKTLKCECKQKHIQIMAFSWA